ncbi:MAG: diguanylate cyclase [Anaerolineales bacterium]|nr:diguanylate cyclase [Anaerolineales bacterium]
MAHKTHPKSKTNSGEGEQTFGLLFGGHPIPMFVYGLKTLAILRVNDAAVKKYGYSRDEFQTLTLKDILPAQDMKKDQPGLLHSGEWRHQCKDGRVIDVDIVSHVLEFDGHQAALVMAQVISECKQAAQTLRESEERYRTLFDSMMDGIYRSTHAGKFVDVNPAMLKMFGYSSKEEMLAVDIKKDLYFAPEERGSHILDTGQEEIEVYRMKRKDGSEIWVEDHGHYAHNEQGEILYHEGMLRDITARKQAEEKSLLQSAALEAAANAIAITDKKGLIEWVNPAWVTLTGYSKEEALGQNPRIIKSGKHDAAFYKNMWDTILAGKIWREELVNRRKDGSLYFEEQTITPVLDKQGNVKNFIAIKLDITERRQAEDDLRLAKENLEVANRELQLAFEHEQQLAHTDDLTGVNNRRHLFELAEHEFDVSRRYQRPLSVIMFDLDHFKQINDTFGHATGDQMLKRVTQVARAQLRDADLIGRYGGEEFLIVLPVTSAQQAWLLAERIRAGVAALRVETDQSPAAITLSLGIAETIHAPQDESIENVIRRADEAMYAAKQAGRNRAVIFDAK